MSFLSWNKCFISAKVSQWVTGSPIELSWLCLTSGKKVSFCENHSVPSEKVFVYLYMSVFVQSVYFLNFCICICVFVFCICESPGNNHPVPWQGRASKAGGLPGQDLSLCLHSTGSPGITFQLFLFSPNCQYSTKNVPLSLLWDEASCLLEQFSHGAGQQILLWSHPCGWNSLLQNTNKMGSPPFYDFFSSQKYLFIINYDFPNSNSIKLGVWFSVQDRS